MPKEIIRYSDEYVVRDGRIVYNPTDGGSRPLEKDEKVSRTEEITVHWSKGGTGDIQLSVQLDAEMVREQLRLYDQDEWLGERRDGMLIFYTGPLRREETQRLVRHIRRARNDVYGADE